MMGVATMNIKDPAVHAMAKELADRRHTTVTGAVREALREALDRHADDRHGIAERLLELAARSAGAVDQFLTDDDLYDEDGLPR